MRIVPLVLLGSGGVGEAFLRQLSAYAERRAGETGVRFLTAAVVTSRAVARFGGLESPRDPHDWESVTRVAREAELLWGARPVFVDATGADTGEAHLRWVEDGFTVVTANKRPLNGPLEAFRRLTEAIDPRGHRSYWFEATVGAKLPVIREIRELVETGDRIARIDAVLSGTLNFLCDAHARGEPFGEAVLSAVALGLAEPDPRLDLLCEDVVRKARILARLAHERPRDPERWDVQRLISGRMLELPLGAFLGRLKGLAEWPSEWPRRGAHEYVVSIDPDAGSVVGRLRPRKRGRAPLVGAENRFVIATARASAPPFMIGGPGAGRDLTASAVFGDLLRSIARL